jgi:hypothetical protein
MPARRFPPPWSAEVTPNCFIVRDANGQALSYVYYESEPGRRFSRETAHQRRGAADCGQYREAARAVTAQDLRHGLPYDGRGDVGRRSTSRRINCSLGFF